MRRTGTYVLHAAFVRPYHASSCHAQDSNVQAADIGAVSSYDRIIDRRTPVLDNADVGGRSAHFKIDAVGSAQVHETSHDRCRRSREHGQHRPLLHLTDLHNSAVSPHDHQRHFHSGTLDALFCGVCRVQHLRQNGCVDRSRPGAPCQPVEFCDLAGRGGFQSHILCDRTDSILIFHIIHTVRFACHDNLRSFTDQRSDGICDQVV